MNILWKPKSLYEFKRQWGTRETVQGIPVTPDMKKLFVDFNNLH